MKNQLPKEKIFLCQKIKRNKIQKEQIFYITKIQKVNEYDISLISTNESQILNENFLNSNENYSLLNNIKIPPFFNDNISNIKIYKRLKKYKEISFYFKDKEEIELYLINKNSIISKKLN